MCFFWKSWGWIWTYLSVGPPDNFENYEKLIKEFAPSDEVLFAIVSRENKKAIDQIFLRNYDHLNAVVEVGTVLLWPELSQT